MTDKKANFCCDCYYAKRTGFIFKTWRCTHPEINKDYLTGGNFKYDICPITAKAINKRGRKEFVFCKIVRVYNWEKHCQLYKGEYRNHPAFPPIKKPLPVPALSERSGFVPPKATPFHNPPEKQEKVEGAI